MSLNWDVTNVKDYENLFNNDNSAVTEAIIFHTIFVGISAITEANVETFFKRVYVYEKLFGPTVSQLDDNGGRSEYRLRFSDIQKRIGLRTNADNFTDAKFKSKILNRSFEEASSFISVSKTS